MEKRMSPSAEVYLLSCRLREQTSPTPNMLKRDNVLNMCDAVCDIRTFLESFSIMQFKKINNLALCF